MSSKLRRETSAQTAENFLQLLRNRRKRHHGRRLMCCARYVFGDGTHDLSCGNHEADAP